MDFLKKETQLFTSLWQSKYKSIKGFNIASIIFMMGSFVFGYFCFISSYVTIIERIAKILMLYGFAFFFIGCIDSILYTIYIHNNFKCRYAKQIMNIICFVFAIITIIILFPFTLFLEKPMTWISKWGMPTLIVLLSMLLVLENYYLSKIITQRIYCFVLTKFDIVMKDFSLKLFIFITIYVLEFYIFTNIWYWACLLKKYIQKHLNRKNFSKKIDIIRNINKLKKEQKDWNTKKLGKSLIFSLLLFLLLFLLNLEFFILKNSNIFFEDTPGMLKGWYSYIDCHRGEIINVLTSYTIILSAIELLFKKNNSKKKEDNDLKDEIKRNLKNFKLWYNY